MTKGAQVSGALAGPRRGLDLRGEIYRWRRGSVGG